MADRIIIAPAASEIVRRAAADFQRYLAQATGVYVPRTESETVGEATGVRFVFGHTGDDGPVADLLTGGQLHAPLVAEGYTLRRLDDAHGPLIAVIGADAPGAVYGTYALLEEAYGCGFFLGSEVVPTASVPLVPATLDLQRAPAFATRGLLPWYDFLSGPSAWNLSDYRLYIDRMVRMGLNFLGLHVYSKGSVTRSQGAEPFLSLTYRGVGHDAALDTTQTSRWGYLPMRTSNFAFGTDRYFADEVFGADAAIAAAGSLDAITRAKALLRDALTYAKERGLRVCVGFEPAALPDEILRTLPARTRRELSSIFGVEQTLDLRSAAAAEILRLRLDDLLTTYPMVDAIWLWQNEDAAWTERKQGEAVLPFDASYLRQAYDYLHQQAPAVQLVVSGWGAVHAHFDELHTALPRDVPFSALNHYLGSSQTDDVYGRIDDRSRWPIPWLEDDATLWHPQYHLHRFRNDVARAHQFGCDGMIGIHWRTRVIDHNAAFFARALWEPDLSPETFYRDYAARLAGGAGGTKLAEALIAVDRTHRWPGWLDEGAVSRPDWDLGHSNEALDGFLALDTPDDVIRDFDAFAVELDAVLAAMEDAAARDHVAYHRAQVAFVQHYVRSQQAARAIDALTETARLAERRLTSAETVAATGQLEALYAAVRAAIEAFVAVMTTTADRGVLASLNQKYVVRACWQRYDALREVAVDPNTLPRPDLTAAPARLRVFVPVPPETVTLDGVELEAVVSDEQISTVTLYCVPLSGGDPRSTPLVRRGRGVWRGTLCADHPIRYWVVAQGTRGRQAVCPAGAPAAAYSACGG